MRLWKGTLAPRTLVLIEDIRPTAWKPNKKIMELIQATLENSPGLRAAVDTGSSSTMGLDHTNQIGGDQQHSGKENTKATQSSFAIRSPMGGFSVATATTMRKSTNYATASSLTPLLQFMCATTGCGSPRSLQPLGHKHCELQTHSRLSRAMELYVHIHAIPVNPCDEQCYWNSRMWHTFQLPRPVLPRLTEPGSRESGGTPVTDRMTLIQGSKSLCKVARVFGQ
jgi:hypothetical protein